MLKYGSLHIGRRLEQSFAGLLSLYLMSKGVEDVDPYSFMPHEEAPVQTFEQQRMKVLGEKSG